MLKDSLNTYFISACFGDKYIGEKPEEVVKQYTENYISEYRRDLEPMYTEDEKDKEDESSIGAWYSYYKGIESMCNCMIKIYLYIASTITNIPEVHMEFTWQLI